MLIPTPVMQLIKQYIAKFPLPTGDPQDPKWDDTIRAWNGGLAQQVAYDFGPMWGLKRADKGRPIGKDSLAMTDGATHLYAWDLLIGSGTGKPQLNENPTFYDLTGTEQVFVPVDSHDYLQTMNQPEPTTPVPPTGTLEEKLNSLMAGMGALLEDAANNGDNYRIFTDAAERQYRDLCNRLDEIKVLLAKKRTLTGSITIPFVGTRTITLTEN